MTTIAKKLQGAGYNTVHAGKWHAGAYATGQVPTSVGFNSSLGYLGGSEGHYNQREGNAGAEDSPVDLFLNGKPAYGMNGKPKPVTEWGLRCADAVVPPGTYGAYMYTKFTVDAIEKHDAAKPLFVYHAWQEAHVPNEVP